jgi:hypothetical protein
MNIQKNNEQPILKESNNVDDEHASPVEMGDWFFY